MSTRLSFSPGNHSYWLADPDTGKKSRVASVTTLLNQLDKPALKKWAPRVAAEYAVDHWDTLAHQPPSERRKAIAEAPWSTMQRAAASGTAIHAMAEDLLAGRPVEVPESLAAQVEGLAKWWDATGMTRTAAEQRVWSDADDDLGLCAFAGTLDLRVSCPRRGPGLLDVKTGAGVYGEHAIQLVAYAVADFAVIEDQDFSSPFPFWLGVLHVRPEGTSLHVVPPEARDAAAARFELLRMLRATDEPWLDLEVTA